MKTSHQQTLFTCDICCQGFTNEKDCKEHENEHQPLKRYKPNTDEKELTLKMYTCDMCHKAFKDENIFKKHKEMHMKFPFTSKFKVRANKEPSVISIDVDNDDDDENVNKEDSDDSDENAKRVFQCDKCRRVIRGFQNWLDHKVYKCGVPSRKFKCQRCTRVIAGLKSWQQHQKINCEVPRKTNSSYSNTNMYKLSDNIRKNLANLLLDATKKTKCELCDVYLTPAEVDNHMNIHKQSHECEICMQIFFTSKSLSEHMVNEHFTAGVEYNWLMKDALGVVEEENNPDIDEILSSAREMMQKTTPCIMCGETFDSEDLLDEHCVRQHRVLHDQNKNCKPLSIRLEKIKNLESYKLSKSCDNSEDVTNGEDFSTQIVENDKKLQNLKKQESSENVTVGKNSQNVTKHDLENITNLEKPGSFENITVDENSEHVTIHETSESVTNSENITPDENFENVTIPEKSKIVTDSENVTIDENSENVTVHKNSESVTNSENVTNDKNFENDTIHENSKSVTNSENVTNDENYKNVTIHQNSIPVTNSEDVTNNENSKNVTFHENSIPVTDSENVTNDKNSENVTRHDISENITELETPENVIDGNSENVSN